MRIEAIYEQGKLEFMHPLQLKHERVKVIVDVPDHEVVFQGAPYELPPEVVAMAKEMEERLDRIRNQPLSGADDLPALTDKQLERIEAFDLRDEVRSMR